MVAIVLNPNSFLFLNIIHYEQNRPKFLVKNHNKYTYIEKLGLMTFLFILAHISHNGLFQPKFKLS